MAAAGRGSSSPSDTAVNRSISSSLLHILALYYTDPEQGSVGGGFWISIGSIPLTFVWVGFSMAASSLLDTFPSTGPPSELGIFHHYSRESLLGFPPSPELCTSSGGIFLGLMETLDPILSLLLSITLDTYYKPECFHLLTASRDL